MSPTAEKSPAYRSFLECMRDFYRLAGKELPYFESSPHLPLTFEAAVGDVKFSVGYDPEAGRASLFIYCPFGSVPSDDCEFALRRLLALNIAMARDHNAAYCIDPVADEVVCYVRRDPTEVGGAWLCQELVRVAQLARQWRNGLSAADDEAPTTGGTDLSHAPWMAFA
jgi:hypothetical protein